MISSSSLQTGLPRRTYFSKKFSLYNLLIFMFSLFKNCLNGFHSAFTITLTYEGMSFSDTQGCCFHFYGIPICFVWLHSFSGWCYFLFLLVFFKRLLADRNYILTKKPDTLQDFIHSFFIDVLERNNSHLVVLCISFPRPKMNFCFSSL